MTKTSVKVLIRPTGEITYISNDQVNAAMRKVGELNIRRASEVEAAEDLPAPTLAELLGTWNPAAMADWRKKHQGTWFADMRRSGGPIQGPFTDRAEAIAWEVEWLNARQLPRPENA